MTEGPLEQEALAPDHGPAAPGPNRTLHPGKCRIKTLRIFCAALAIAGASHAASAHEIALSKQHAACMDKSGSVTMDMIDCITAETQRQDARLNKAYKVLMAELSSPRKKQLQEAQCAWLKYRDANCAFYDDPDGGTLARVNANSCMMTATASRAHELESFKLAYPVDCQNEASTPRLTGMAPATPPARCWPWATRGLPIGVNGNQPDTQGFKQ